MLRTYTQIIHPISTLQNMVKYLVCEVWCEAREGIICSDLLATDFKVLYEQLDWLKKDTDIIFEKCKILLDDERTMIVKAFVINNNIEDLCNGTEEIIELNSLPAVISTDIKSLLEAFYSRLLDIKKVPGEKLEYYNILINENKFNTCPVCGLANIETSDSKYIEDYDHFFPKALYPFSAVNFNNLVPTCDKCNKKHKGTKKPLDNNGKVYYPFEKGREPIKVELKLNKIEFDTNEKLTEKPIFNYSGDNEKNSTWNWLYNIDDRYSGEVKRFSYSWLRTLKKEIEFNNAKTAAEYIDFKISNYEFDKFDEMKFLKIALLNELKLKQEWMAVL